MFSIINNGRKEEKNYVDQRIVIYVTAKEKENIKKVASDNGMDVSTMFRFLIRKRWNRIFGSWGEEEEDD